MLDRSNTTFYDKINRDSDQTNSIKQHVEEALSSDQFCAKYFVNSKHQKSIENPRVFQFVCIMMSNTLQYNRHTVKKNTVNYIETSKMMNKELFKSTIIKSHDNRPVARNRKIIAYQFLQEYLNNSSVQGLKYFSNSQIKSGIIGKLFWAVIMICSFVFLTMMLQKFWEHYSVNPTRTVVKSFHIPIFKAPFPALTICPLIPPMASRRRKVFQSLRVPHNMTNSTTRFLIRYGPAFANENAIGGKSHLDEMKLLLKTNNMTLLDFVKALRPCEDLFESCMWNDISKNCSELFKISYTYTGICCSFNYLLEDYIKNDRKYYVEQDDNLLTTTLFGPRSGLMVVLHRDFLIENDHTKEKYVKYSTNSVGLVMFSHHPLEYIATIATRQILQAQQELQIAISPSIKRKPNTGYYNRNSHGKLVPLCARRKAELKYFPTYRYSNCFTSCSIRAVLQICGCVPISYTPMANKYSLKICDWEDFHCLYANANSTRIIQNVDTKNFTCECLTPCWSVEYELQSTTIPLNGDHDFNFPPYKNLSKAQSILKVYMKSATFMEMSTIPIADEIYLLASLGGVFNLFLGCSFISILEIFYYVALFFHSQSKTKKSK